MIRVVVERTFAISAIGCRHRSLRATRERACLHDPSGHLEAQPALRDRRRMICEFEAPDAESVRRVQRQSEAEAERVWTAEVIE